MSMRPSSLRIRAVSKAFGPLTVLDDLTLEFEAGRITALLGPNGAGKTTLLKCVLGLVRADTGSILVDQSATDEQGRYREDIGFMPQLPHFPGHMTGRELACMLDELRGFRGTPDEELVHALDLERDLDKPFRTLSGGTRQKVNAALAFRYPTSILILDEPTAGLDPVASLALKDKVRRCRVEGRTVIITSHKLGELQALADDIVFLHEGRTRFVGPLERLLESTGRSTLEEAIAGLMQGEERGGGEGGARTGDESSAALAGEDDAPTGDGDAAPKLRVVS